MVVGEDRRQIRGDGRHGTLPASRNIDIMRADKLGMIRLMRMVLHPLCRTIAVLATIVFVCAPFGANMAHAGNTPHHALVQTVGNGPVIVTAPPMAMHAGSLKACCPVNSGLTKGAGCSAVVCSSPPGTLVPAFVAEGPSRPMRDCFCTLQNKLSPHNLAPEHGPPRA